jgi:signal transduction histidine kinase
VLTDLLFEEPGIGRCLVAPDRTVLRANGEWLRSTGFSLDEVLGADIIDLFPGTRDMAIALHARARAGHHVAVPCHAQRISGRDTWWEGTISPVPMENGTGLLITARELSLEVSPSGTDDERAASSSAARRQLAAAERLHALSTQLIQADDTKALFERVLDTAIAIMRSDFASIQMLDVTRGELLLLGFRGFSTEAAKFWDWVRPGSQCACGRALRTEERVVVADVERCDWIAGSEDLETYRQAGIRAVQTTPLLSRSGAVIGMISTQWRQPHDPSPHDLRMLDLLARQAADLIDRKRAEDALREADRRKTEFLGVLSHELRNPLAPLRNSIYLLEHAAPGSEQATRAGQVIRRQTEHLTRLIEDLLDVTRISHGKMPLQRHVVDLREVVRKTTDDREVRS